MARVRLQCMHGISRLEKLRFTTGRASVASAEVNFKLNKIVTVNVLYKYSST